MLPERIQRFIDVFSKLPSVGPRMARRLAFYLVHLDKQTFKNVEQALAGLEKLNQCPRCFATKDADRKLCKICSSPARDKYTVAIVEKETDLLSLEQTGKFHGTYLVLGTTDRDTLETTHKLKLKHLASIATKELGEPFNELIIATGPTAQGDFLAESIMKLCAGCTKKITRLGRGLPTGGDIEFADEGTLGSALERRV